MTLAALILTVRLCCFRFRGSEFLKHGNVLPGGEGWLVHRMNIIAVLYLFLSLQLLTLVTVLMITNYYLFFLPFFHFDFV